MSHFTPIPMVKHVPTRTFRATLQHENGDQKELVFPYDNWPNNLRFVNTNRLGMTCRKQAEGMGIPSGKWKVINLEQMSNGQWKPCEVVTPTFVTIFPTPVRGNFRIVEGSVWESSHGCKSKVITTSWDEESHDTMVHMRRLTPFKSRFFFIAKRKLLTNWKEIL